MKKVLDVIKVFFKALGNFYYAWVTMGDTAKIRSEAELLKALHKKLEAEKMYADFDGASLDDANKIIESINIERRKQREKTLIIMLPIVFLLMAFYGVVTIFLELIRLFFNSH